MVKVNEVGEIEKVNHLKTVIFSLSGILILGCELEMHLRQT